MKLLSIAPMIAVLLALPLAQGSCGFKSPIGTITPPPDGESATPPPAPDGDGTPADPNALPDANGQPGDQNGGDTPDDGGSSDNDADDPEPAPTNPLSVSPQYLDFRSVVALTPFYLAITISNPNDVPVEVQVTQADFPFMVLGAGTSTISPQGSLRLDIEFRPLLAQAYASQFAVIVESLGQSATVSLRGTGV